MAAAQRSVVRLTRSGGLLSVDARNGQRTADRGAEARVAQLTAIVERSQEERRSSRRDLLRLAGAAAVGTVGAAVSGSGRAAATDGAPPKLGVVGGADNTATLPTGINYTGGAAAGAGAFAFQAGTTFDNASLVAYPPVLGAIAGNAAHRNAIFAFTTQAEGFAVIGRSATSATGGTGGAAWGSSANHSTVDRESSAGPSRRALQPLPSGPA